MAFLAQQLSITWFNLRLKRRDTVLDNLISGCTPEDKSALRNKVMDDSDNLFPEEVIRDVLQSHKTRTESAVLRKAISSSGKRRSSPSKDTSASGVDRPAKVQKSVVHVATSNPAASGKGSQQSFPKAQGKSKGRQKGRGKKRGGSN